ncbi:hypothetical protein [Prevotella jejuni]|uniref:hypothetical protein n=1 Tax=Prevotella jejuni TaxID=1177574 RepID=UPI00352D364D
MMLKKNAMNIYKILTTRLEINPTSKLVLIYLLSLNKREIEAQIKYIGEIICGFKKDNVHRQMTKVINELVEQGYILPLKDIYAKNKFKSKKWVLTAKALKLAKDDNTDSQGNKAKATSNKINIPTQVNGHPTRVEINAKKEQAPQQEYKPSLAEQRRQLEEAIKD